MEGWGVRFGKTVKENYESSVVFDLKGTGYIKRPNTNFTEISVSFRYLPEEDNDYNMAYGEVVKKGKNKIKVSEISNLFGKT